MKKIREVIKQIDIGALIGDMVRIPSYSFMKDDGSSQRVRQGKISDAVGASGYGARLRYEKCLFGRSAGWKSFRKRSLRYERTSGSDDGGYGGDKKKRCRD